MKIIRLFLIFFISIYFTHCADLINLLKKGSIEEPDVRVIKTRIAGLSFKQIDLVFDIQIDNPNPAGISLAGFDYDLLLNNISFLKGEEDKVLEIKANDIATIQLPLSLLFENIYATYQRLKNEDKISYTLSTGLTFNLPVLGELRIPVSTSGDFPAIKVPSVHIKYLKLNHLSFTGADFKLAIGINNPNSVGFIIENLDYNLMINNTLWAEGQTSDELTIHSNKDNTLLIPFTLNLLQIGSALYKEIGEGKNFNYQFKGQANLTSSMELLGKLTLPFNMSGKINLTK
jgi:LEA14-like dessication related protein